MENEADERVQTVLIVDDYPNGLSGDDIPLSARLMMVADVDDACVSRRVYKASMPYREVAGRIMPGSGSQFDREVVEVYIELQEEFAAIAERLAGSREMVA